MKPTVGRIVHYTNLGDRDGKYPPEVQAALITKVVERQAPEGMGYKAGDEGAYHVSLRIFYETGTFMMKDVPFTSAEAGSEQARGHWTWPART